MVLESYLFPHTSHILIHHFLINKCLWNCITLIKLMIKTSHTFAVKLHTNPAVFIQHACRHSVIQKDKLNAQIFSYHIHILCTEYSAYFIAINGLVIFWEYSIFKCIQILLRHKALKSMCSFEYQNANSNSVSR